MSLKAASPAISATVAASAGTGKTYLLVARIVRLLLEGVPPDRILAVTFTRKAAAEMQARIHQRLLTLLELADPALDQALEELGMPPSAGLRGIARGLYERVLRSERPIRTLTFHSLCAEILRRFPLEAEVPAGFDLLERTALLEQQAWDALVSEATRRPDAPVALALETLFNITGSLASTRGILGGFLAHRSDWWAFTEDCPDPVARALERLEQIIPVASKDPLQGLRDDASRKRLARFRELLAGHGTKENAKHVATLDDLLAAERLDDYGFEQLQSVFFTGSGTPRSRKAGNKALERSIGAAAAEELVELHDWFCARIERLREELNALANKALNEAWYLAGSRLLDHYQRIKRVQRSLDFADLEWQAYRLLNRSGHAEWIQFKMDQRVDHILIDEFQDTNPTQWRLVLPLLEELTASDGRSAFLVGDPKQSIYGFRRADYRLQEQASTWLTERAAAQAFTLSRSYRSSPAIIALVNQVFAQSAENQRLPGFDPHETHHLDLWGRVELHGLSEPAPAESQPLEGLRDPLDLAIPREEAAAHYREGQRIAARIAELQAAPLAVRDGGADRPLRYDDVFILVRRRTQIEHYERALRDAGIPYLGIDRRKLLERLEVLDLEALLRILLAPFDDVALAQVLRSPLFAASDDDLLALACSEAASSWYDRLLALAADQPRQSPLGRAGHWLPRWRALLGHLPVHDLLDRIFSQGDVLARFTSATHPAHRPRVRANLNRFLELALELDSGRYPSLVHFLATLATLRGTEDAPDETTAQPGEACVRILTIHAAKGLEAPIVFLADTAAAPADDSGYQTLVDWSPGAPRPRALLLAPSSKRRDSETARLISEKQSRDTREDANLLYVALTRARQMLVITGTVTSRSSKGSWYELLAQSMSAVTGVEREVDGTLVFERGERPRLVRPPGAPPKPTIEPPPGLQHRWDLQAAPPPLAPSAPEGGFLADTATDAEGRLRGTGIHLLLEWLTAERPMPVDELLARAAVRLGLDPGARELADWLVEARAVIEDPALAFLFDPGRYERAYNEVPVSYRHEGRQVNGVIDRVVITSRTAYVVDYKTHFVEDPGELAGLAMGYLDQLSLYTEAATRLWPEHRIEARLLFTRARELVEPGSRPETAD